MNPNEEKIVRSLKDIKEVFDRNKIPFWLQYGTLLGAVRDKKIISWDNEVDLETFKSYFEKKEFRKKITKELEEKGFFVYFLLNTFNNADTLNTERGKIMLNMSLLNPKKNWVVIERLADLNSVSRLLLRISRILDVYYYGRFRFFTSNGFRGVFKLNACKIISSLPPGFRKDVYKTFELVLSPFKKSERYSLKISDKHFRNLEKIKYYNLNLNIPGSTEEYLEKFYGDWKTPLKYNQKWVWYEHGAWEKIRRV